MKGRDNQKYRKKTVDRKMYLIPIYIYRFVDAKW